MVMPPLCHSSWRKGFILRCRNMTFQKQVRVRPWFEAAITPLCEKLAGALLMMAAFKQWFSTFLGCSDSLRDCSANLVRKMPAGSLSSLYVSLPILSFFHLTRNFFLFFLACCMALWPISWAPGLLESCVQCPGKPAKRPRVENGA